jgi:hypothetical protein
MRPMKPVQLCWAFTAPSGASSDSSRSGIVAIARRIVGLETEEILQRELDSVSERRSGRSKIQEKSKKNPKSAYDVISSSEREPSTHWGTLTWPDNAERYQLELDAYMRAA